MARFFTLCAVMLLAACSDISNPLPQTTATFKDESAEKTKPFRAQIADFIYPEVTHEYVVDPAPVVIVHPFCYKTWDKPVCYDRPELGQEARLVGATP